MTITQVLPVPVLLFCLIGDLVYEPAYAFIKKKVTQIPITTLLLHRRSNKMKVRRRTRGQIPKMEPELWPT